MGFKVGIKTRITSDQVLKEKVIETTQRHDGDGDNNDDNYYENGHYNRDR